MLHQKGEEGKEMNDNVRVEKILETLYGVVTDRIPENVCRQCPVVQLICDLRDNIKDANNEQIALELGIAMTSAECPCMKRC
jgi:hypothetical protein